MTDKETFEKLQAKYRTANFVASELTIALQNKYQETRYAKPAERKQLDGMHRRTQKAADAIYLWLDRHSPRNWRSGVPSHWICSTLRYDDAVTRGPLAVIPPLAYGARPEDIARMARPV